MRISAMTEWHALAGDIFVPKLDLIEPLLAELSDFVGCVRPGDKPVSDGDSGLRVVRVLEVACISLARGGVPVALD